MNNRVIITGGGAALARIWAGMKKAGTTKLFIYSNKRSLSHAFDLEDQVVRRGFLPFPYLRYDHKGCMQDTLNCMMNMHVVIIDTHLLWGSLTEQHTIGLLYVSKDVLKEDEG